MIEHDTAYQIWAVCKEYIPSKDREAAADQLVSMLIDLGLDEEILVDICGHDKWLKQAAQGYEMFAAGDHTDLDFENE